jgi:hypothetical protein
MHGEWETFETPLSSPDSHRHMNRVYWVQQRAIQMAVQKPCDIAI